MSSYYPIKRLKLKHWKTDRFGFPCNQEICRLIAYVTNLQYSRIKDNCFNESLILMYLVLKIYQMNYSSVGNVKIMNW